MSVAAQPLALFISYSHKDDDLRAKLDAHLSLLKRQNVFDVWHDRRIGAGREWAGEINDALERADVVMLLVSSDFLASDYCYDKEMVRALQRHDEGSARVVPVILRPCDWQSSQFGKLLALPRDGKPVVSHPDTDSALTEVAHALRALADQMRGGGATSNAIDASATAPGKVAPVRPEPAPARRLKIGAIKLWFLEIGPFELDWPPRFGATSLITMAVAAAVVLTTLAAVPYWFVLKPRLDEARNFMRRGEYASAAGAAASAPTWSAALPSAAGIAEQARFGARLAAGEHIRNLTPELDALGKKYPHAPDVLVFQGLKSYYVDEKITQALEQFTLAANRDEAHVEAHFLAAGRHIEIAYAELAQGAKPQALSAAAEARKLIDRARTQSPYAESLPRYANQIAELYELEGNVAGAYASYAKLAPLHPLSALQATFVAWRLPGPGTALDRSLEGTEVAIGRVEKESAESIATEGWSFRVGATETIDLRSKAEKICLLQWAVEISKSLQSASGTATPIEGAAPAPPGPATSPANCGTDAVAARMRQIVCVQVLTAGRVVGPDDDRQEILENWRTSQLRCDRALQPLPALRPRSADVKRTYLPGHWGGQSEPGLA